MARLITEGFEWNDLEQQLLWENFGSSSASLSGTAARTGSYGLLCDNTAGATSSGLRLIPNFGEDATNRIARMYIRVETAPADSITVIYIRQGTSSPGISIHLTSARKLQLFQEDPFGSGALQLGADSAALTLATWYRVELKYAYGAVTGTATGYLDGASFATGSCLGGVHDVFAVCLGDSSLGESTGKIYIDDVAMNNSTGGAQTDLPGAGSIIFRAVNAAGDNAMGSRGGANSGSDFGQLDENPPNNATDYYILDADNDIIDLGLQDLSGTINAGSTINLVAVGFKASLAGGGASAIKLRIKSQASGTLAESASFTSLTSSWTCAPGSSDLHKLISYVDPQAGGPWTMALFDAAQIGVQATDAAPDVWITSLWAVVEYIEAAPPAGAVNINRDAVQLDSRLGINRGLVRL